MTSRKGHYLPGPDLPELAGWAAWARDPDTARMGINCLLLPKSYFTVTSVKRWENLRYAALLC